MSASKTLVNVRAFNHRDVDPVTRIEWDSFERDPWSRGQFTIALRQQSTLGVVAEDGTGVIGFAIYSLHSDFLELRKIAVDAKRRREGVASQILEKLTDPNFGPAIHRRRIDVICRESLLGGLLFFRAVGFRASERPILRDYYHETGEDAYLLTYTPTGFPPDPTLVLGTGPCNRIRRYLSQ